jgi:hypothetical protein
LRGLRILAEGIIYAVLFLLLSHTFSANQCECGCPSQTERISGGIKHKDPGIDVKVENTGDEENPIVIVVDATAVNTRVAKLKARPERLGSEVSPFKTACATGSGPPGTVPTSLSLTFTLAEIGLADKMVGKATIETWDPGTSRGFNERPRSSRRFRP